MQTTKYAVLTYGMTTKAQEVQEMCFLVTSIASVAKWFAVIHIKTRMCLVSAFQVIVDMFFMFYLQCDLFSHTTLHLLFTLFIAWGEIFKLVLSFPTPMT